MESAEKSSSFRVKVEDEERVTLRVQLSGKPDFCFTMKRDEPLRNLMMAFCERPILGSYTDLVFIINGGRVRGHETPNDLQLENGDVIVAMRR